MPDVTIIGAGPAGSTAAVLLARAGWDVTLVEQSRFPRDKVCGECLSSLGFEVLGRLGLADAFLRRGAIRLGRAELHTTSGRSLRIELPSPMWGLSRHAFDELLLDAARAAGTRVRQPVRCESVERADRPVLRIRDLTANTVETLTSSHVLLADGKAVFATDPPAPTGDFGIKTHFERVDGPRDAVELFGVRGSYGGLAAIEGGRWNAAFSVPAARLRKHRGNIEELFAEITGENPALARRLAGAIRVGGWLAAPLPRFAVRKHWPANVIPMGNAAGALEPIGGEGMGLAMRSAELAAAALLSHGDAATLRRRFSSLWRARRFGCRTAALSVSTPRIGDLLVQRRVPSLAVRAALRLIGKSVG